MKNRILQLILVFSFVFTACKDEYSGYEDGIYADMETNKGKIINYIKKDTFHDYIRSPYGFWYRYIIKDPKNSISPKKGDLVQISYEISDLKDQIIYSKQLNGIKDYKVDEEDFIPGIQQGLKLMKIGETIKFIIPSFNAYDIVGDGNKIGINKSIISIVTLINIK